MKYRIEVENIKCGGCAGSIQSSLSNIKGTEKVDVDIEHEIVTVSSVDENAHDIIVSKLADMGYPEKGNNNLLAKAKSYVSCAVGRMNASMS